jgi:hypothetical protein
MNHWYFWYDYLRKYDLAVCIYVCNICVMKSHFKLFQYLFCRWPSTWVHASRPSLVMTFIVSWERVGNARKSLLQTGAHQWAGLVCFFGMYVIVIRLLDPLEAVHRSPVLLSFLANFQCSAVLPGLGSIVKQKLRSENNIVPSYARDRISGGVTAGSVYSFPAKFPCTLSRKLANQLIHCIIEGRHLTFRWVSDPLCIMKSKEVISIKICDACFYFIEGSSVALLCPISGLEVVWITMNHTGFFSLIWWLNFFPSTAILDYL